MDFPTWLALHRRSLDTLPVRPGAYVARYRAGAEERYSATLRLSQHASGTLVCVTTPGGVRARVHHEGGEYLFQPVWGGERGLRVHRLLLGHIQPLGTSAGQNLFAQPHQAYESAKRAQNNEAAL